MAPDSMSGTSSAMLLTLRISAPVPSDILAHADAHVEPAVAVDQVVAAAALDDVAAGAAEDDVARAELVVGSQQAVRAGRRSQNVRSPLIRSRLVSTLPVKPASADLGRVGDRRRAGCRRTPIRTGLRPRRSVASTDGRRWRRRRVIDGVLEASRR